MTRPLIVIGAGGFGRESLDVAQAMNLVAPVWDILGVIDSSPSSADLLRLRDRGVDYLGTDEGLIAERGAEFIVGIGSPSVRASVTARLAPAGLTAATLIHPQSVIGTSNRIGPGSVICAGVQVSTNVRLGSHVHLNPNSTVGHDSVLQNYVSVNPGAIVSGDVVVHEGTLLGAGAVILQGLTVGAGSIVGAAACVVSDVPPSTTVKGIPAR